ncbi:uncharacterized protein LOC117569056 [Drosophila albomicans]|uniref:Uncharacterized protein LOC117569056 n=1 Tax=Drosophila albomicans TaxID=7291 RepID=A0A6P8X2M0_DROAB|nr:uncharacterized protein LOC117569056 [Drosophila albomicans]
MKLTVIFLLLHLLHHIACEKSYVVTNEQLDAFEGDSESLVSFDTLRTIGEERALNGSFSFLGDMNNDDFKVSVELYSSPKSDGDYKRIVFDVPPTNICDCFKKFYVQFVQPSVREGDITNFPLVDEDSCPIPQGEFFIKKLIFNIEDWPDQVPRGLVKAIITFWNDGNNVGGLIVVVRIEDRDS